MIRIRVGASWKHDPGVRAALRRGAREARRALRIIDVLAFEVDGVDIGAGRTEGDLLPSLERVLRAVAALLGGAPQASVPFGDGGVELVLHRRGASALLTLVALERPARLLAREVEVDLAALAAAALQASADLVGDLAAAGPLAASSSQARRLRDAARRLRATEPSAPAGPRRDRRPRPRPPAAPPGTIACAFEIEDDRVLDGYGGGGRPDLASLLAPGRVVLRDGAGAEICAVEGAPFLLLRDLSMAAERLARSVRSGESRLEIALAQGRGGTLALEVDLARGRLSPRRGTEVPCPPLDLARALLVAARGFVAEVRARNPRQGENPWLAELDAGSAERLAHVAELAGGDLVGRALPARATPPRPPPARPLGPGRLRRVAFRRIAEADVGTPAGPGAAGGLLGAAGLVVASGGAATLAIEPLAGRIVWRGPGCDAAAATPRALLLARGGSIDAVSPRTGARRWTRPLAAGPPRGVVALARGPIAMVEGGAITAVDPDSGRLAWRFSPAGASRVTAAGFGRVLLVGSDAGFLYGLDAAGAVAFRLRLPGPVLHAPVHGLGGALVVTAPDGGEGGASLLAVDPAAGARRWEVPLDFTPSAPPLVLGARAVAVGTLGGDPIATCVRAGGRTDWTVAPALSGPVAAAASGAATFLQDGGGSVVALGGDGSTRWTFARGDGHPPPGPVAPAAARGTVLSGAEGLAALDATSGDLLGSAPDVAPVRLRIGPDLSAIVLEADGTVVVLRLATHLSVV
jgi:outer membrane protein assembly factor BamB